MKHTKHKVKKGMHKMPNGKMMFDEEMEKYHATRGKSMMMDGGRGAFRTSKKRY